MKILITCNPGLRRNTVCQPSVAIPGLGTNVIYIFAFCKRYRIRLKAAGISFCWAIKFCERSVASLACLRSFWIYSLLLIRDVQVLVLRDIVFKMNVVPSQELVNVHDKFRTKILVLCGKSHETW